MINKIKLLFSALLSKITNSRLAQDSFWAIFGNGLAYFILLISGILIARMLGKDVYGEYGIVKTSMFYLAAFSTFGLGYTSTKFVSNFLSKHLKDVYSIIRASICITIISSGTLALLVIVFAKHLSLYLNEPTLKLAFQFLGIIIVFRALSTTINGILAGFKSFKEISIISLVSGFTLLILATPMTYIGGLRGALFSLAMSQFCNALLGVVFLHKKCYVYKKEVNRKYFKELLVFSFPVALQELSFALCGWLSSLLLVKYSSSGEMALYSISAQWNSIIVFIPSLLYNVVLSYLSEDKDNISHLKIMKKMILLNFLCTLIPFILVFIFTDFIVSFYGSTYDGELQIVMRCLIFETIFVSCSRVLQSEFIAQGRTWPLFTLRFLRDSTLLVSVYVLLRMNNGINGALYFAISSIISSVIYFLTLLIGWKFKHSKI